MTLDVRPNTARHYLDILQGTYVLRVLPPWFENLKKRQVKAPKIYVRNSGLLHYVVYPGTERYPLLERVEALPLVDLPGLQSNTQLDLQ